MQFVAVRVHRIGDLDGLYSRMSPPNPAGIPVVNALAISFALCFRSVCRYAEVVETDACLKLSRTVVSAAPRASAWVAWVCRIQCGLARRNFSANSESAGSNSTAANRKNLFMIAHRRAPVSPNSSSPKLPSRAVSRFHRLGEVGIPREAK